MTAANGSCLPVILLIESENAKQSHESAFQGLDEAARRRVCCLLCEPRKVHPGYDPGGQRLTAVPTWPHVLS